MVYKIVEYNICSSGLGTRSRSESVVGQRLTALFDFISGNIVEKLPLVGLNLPFVLP